KNCHPFRCHSKADTRLAGTPNHRGLSLGYRALLSAARPRRGRRGRTPMSSASSAQSAANVLTTLSSSMSVTCAVCCWHILSITTEAARISRSYPPFEPTENKGIVLHKQRNNNYSEWCVYRILDSTILMVKAAEDRSRCNGAEALNDATKRCILGQGSMSPE